MDERSIKLLSGKKIHPDGVVNIVIINTARAFSNLTAFDINNLLIVDECHRAGSPENSRALKLPKVASIGLSATPYRDYDDGLDSYIIPNLGPILYHYGLSDAIRDGVLSNLKLTYVKIPLLPVEQAKYDDFSRKIAIAMGGDDVDQLTRILRARSRLYNGAFYRLPVSRALLDQRRGKRTIIFLESIQAADTLYVDLQADGHSTTIYHSGMSAGLRRSNLRLFRRGVFDVLVTCRALDEGFNVPEAEVAIIAAGTSSIRQRTQRVGRVLRTVGNKRFGEVLTLYATPVEERRLAQEAEDLGLSAQTLWQETNVE